MPGLLMELDFRSLRRRTGRPGTRAARAMTVRILRRGETEKGSCELRFLVLWRVLADQLSDRFVHGLIVLVLALGDGFSYGAAPQEFVGLGVVHVDDQRVQGNVVQGSLRIEEACTSPGALP